VNEKDTTMTEKTGIGLLLGLILAACVLLAGCSSQSSSGSTTVTTTTTTMPGPLYVAGDIVAKSSTQTAPLWLILSYDSASDQYERALIYQNSDGSWGYRVNSASDTLPRADMEKIYPVKVAHVTATSVPIVTPTAPPTVQTTIGSLPSITAVSPTSAAQNAIVSLTITGSNFQSGATVRLVQPGFAPVVGSGVSVSSSQISGTFNLNGLGMGLVNIEVINPDGGSAILPSAFTIGKTPPTITGVTPTTGALGSSVPITITGTNFATAVTVFLGQGSLTIPCSSTTATSTSVVTTTCDLSNSNAAIGSWNVTLINIDGGQSGTWSTFSITNSS